MIDHPSPPAVPDAVTRAMREISACRHKDELRDCYCPNCDNSLSDRHLCAALTAFLDPEDEALVEAVAQSAAVKEAVYVECGVDAHAFDTASVMRAALTALREFVRGGGG